MSRRSRGQPSSVPPVRRWTWRLVLALLLAAMLALVFDGVVQAIDVPPRALGPYLEHRSSGHHSLWSSAGSWVSRRLVTLDRGEPTAQSPAMLKTGAGGKGVGQAAQAGLRTVHVASAAQATQALNDAQPGDMILFEPGVYRIDTPLVARIAGKPTARITVAAARPGSVLLEVQSVEGFVVSAPYWSIQGLTLRGVCERHSDCEHAFHVVGDARYFIARNNKLVDFNAHIKVNGHLGRFPDDGVIESNTLTNTAVRDTDNPVTPIDMVAASRWVVRDNLITDFVKAGGNRISYGAFAKGGGSGTVFRGNVVYCERALRGLPGWRVGLSFGGGGSGPEHCRDVACVIEQEAGVMESNIIAGCSDDGIYVNRGASSRIVHNTLVDTGGIVVRFVESSAEVNGNLVDGPIRVRDDALLHAHDNLDTHMAWLYLGRHPHRSLFKGALAFDFTWRGESPRRNATAAPSPDLCGVVRRERPAYGAFEDFSACLQDLSIGSPRRP